MKDLISTMLRILILQCFMLVLFVPYANAKVRGYALADSSSVRYTDTLEQCVNTPRVKCLVQCYETDGCYSVNHNSDTDKCELATHIPRVLAPSSETEPNWRVYYHDPFIRAADAWQITTYRHGGLGVLGPGLAIDGYRNTCAHTKSGFSHWTMKFERVAEVYYVIIYFRNDVNMNHRNVNLRLLISTTKEESDDNVGEDCATYDGPPASPAVPVTITCTQPVTGKFLKIIHNYASYLTLCEVEAYSI